MRKDGLIKFAKQQRHGDVHLEVCANAPLDVLFVSGFDVKHPKDQAEGETN